MAEGLFKQTLIDANKSDRMVNSAGLSALVGHPPDPNACSLMMEKGIDISGYRACQLNQEMIRKSELILVMELSQKYILEENEPSARGKIFRLGEFLLSLKLKVQFLEIRLQIPDRQILCFCRQ